MNPGRNFWRVRVSSAAEVDFDQIVRWTTEQFGEDQADNYAETLLAAFDALKEGPTLAGVRAHNDLPKGVQMLHSARSGRKSRHVILFRVEPGSDLKVIQVLRILHDAMDLPRHLDLDGE